MADDDLSLRPVVNQRVHVRLPGWATNLPSRVEEVEDDGRLAVTATGSTDPLNGDVVTLSWDGPTGVYELQTVLEGVRRREIPLWDLKASAPAAHRQRRAHVRVHTERPIEFVRYGELHKARCVDLSEGGMSAVVTDKSFVAAGDAVSVTIPLEEEEGIVAVNAQVVRVIVERDAPRRFAARFLQLSVKDEDALRREVFAMEADQRQTRLDD